MGRSLHFTPRASFAPSEPCRPQTFREPTSAERIALELMEDERRAHTHRTRPGPSAPRRFSWETEQ